MEAFNFSPVDRVPSGTYKDKPVDYWSWLDFYFYFENRYASNFGGRNTSIYTRNSKKKAIEKAIDVWGRQTFKAMIDWLFDNYKDHPEWKSLHIGLLCGNHNWAKMIGENAIKQMEVDKRWNS